MSRANTESDNRKFDFYPTPSGETPDRLTNPDAFQKVQSSLEQYANTPILVYKPSVTMIRRGIGQDTDSYESIGNLGIVTKEAISMAQKTGRIVLPTTGYISGIRMHGNIQKEEGTIEFHCNDPENVNIFDTPGNSKRLNRVGVEIHVGYEAVEDQFQDSPTIYYRAMNLLGQQPTGPFFKKHGKQIEEDKNRFLGGLKDVVRGHIANPTLRGDKTRKYLREIDEWNVAEIFPLEKNVFITLRQFLKEKSNQN